jgi:PRC-barrel domain
MVTRIIAAGAVSAFMVATAAAQAPSAPPSSAEGGSGAAGIAVVTEQKSDQWLASKLIGTSVYNASNEKIGSISDLLVDNNGATMAAIVGVGGFLGLGEKKVAVHPKSLHFARSNEGDKVMFNVSKDELKQAAEFKPYNPPPPPPPTASRSPMSPPPMGGVPTTPSPR